MRLIDMDKLEGSLHTTETSEFFDPVTSAEISEWLDGQPIVAQWHKLIFRNLTPEEEKEYANFDWSYMVENLPDYGEEVLVTDGKNVWIDSFDEDAYVYLSGTDSDLDNVIAWMELPDPYRREQ